MLVRLQPLPDELDRSYLGALMRFNGETDEMVTLQLIASWAGTADLPRRRNPAIQLLSAAAGMDLPGFVRDHTTLPLRRSITSYLTDLEHGSRKNLELIHCSGFRLNRPAAYLCHDCVWEDFDFHGRSYWRREHQTPGLFWCPKHRGPLSVVADETAFFDPPTQVVGRAAKLDANWTDDLQQNPLIGRFLELCGLLIDRPHPYPVTATRDALRIVARPRQLRCYPSKGDGSCSEPLLSDAMLDAFPTDWLVQIVPALKDKQRRTIFHPVDGVLWNATSASAAVVYILSLALLFNSSDEADLAIRGAMCSPSTEPRAKSKPVGLGDARAKYIGAGGNHSKLRRMHSNEWYPLLKVLQEAGLPSLPQGHTCSAVAAAKAFFVDSAPLDHCLAVSGDARSTFEALLRSAGQPLANALVDIDRQAGRIALGKKRSRGSLDILDQLGLLERPETDAALQAKGRQTLRAGNRRIGSPTSPA